MDLVEFLEDVGIVFDNFIFYCLLGWKGRGSILNIGDFYVINF